MTPFASALTDAGAERRSEYNRRTVIVAAPSVSVIIPCHNEAKNLLTLLPEVARVLDDARLPWEVIVVDDNSADDTSEAVRRLSPQHTSLRLVERRDGHPGVGRTLRAGFAAATSSIVITMDGDGSHAPADLPRLIQAINEGADLTIGSRYGEWKGDRHMALSRRIISGAYSVAARVLLGTPVADLTSGYRAIRREALDRLALKADGFEIHAEIHLKAIDAGLRVTQTPIVYLTREGGQSKLRYVRVGGPYASQLVRSFARRLKRRLSGP
ncbi:MAG: glycosyltransferase [Dehalococcoidia bacterium]|jgi:glycosyltransferase involved in cell wall biosynthesis|nr:glycosyltransferase [Dehalococcoidia bacterium]